LAQKGQKTKSQISIKERQSEQTIFPSLSQFKQN